MTSQQTQSTERNAAALSELMFPATVRCISIAAQHRIADLLATGPRHFKELAKRSGTDADALAKALRLLAEEGVFQEVGDGVFANTPMSECLRPGVPGSLHSMARMVGEPWMWASWGSLDVSVATGEAAFEQAFGTSLWAWFAANPDSARTFNEAMAEFSGAFSTGIVRAYREFGDARVVADLGGGLGAHLAAILAEYPSVERGVLVDLPSVIDQARRRPELAQLIQQGRCDMAPGDFFAGVPTDVDVYVTKQIMHSWQDDQVTQLLRRCREASPRATVVCAELVHHRGSPRFVKNFDLVMLVTMSGSVRSAEQFDQVFRRAGYRVSRVIGTETPFSLIEGVPA
ncbi:MAG TPA: methyltransferase [Streptosporangiaceae bacterium]|nr:methyltransferase [Streptosporangiaceae bacterium]